MLAVETAHLSKSFGAVVAVNRLSLRIPEGTVYGFLGPNGAGKTTTLRLLVGLAKPDGGEITIFGVRAGFGYSGYQHLVGYLTETPSFYGWMTAFEYLRFVARLFQLAPREAERRSEALLDMVGLSGKRRRVSSFSRGMRQRLGIAQALINHPRVLILDEPTSALDPIARKDVLTLIRRVAKDATVIMSTHILNDVEQVCDHVGIINRGRLVADGALTELQRRYIPRLVRLEVEGAEDRLCATLSGLEWVRRISRSGKSIDVRVSDVQTARERIIEVLHYLRLPLTRFEIVDPSLEDMFVTLVRQDERGL